MPVYTCISVKSFGAKGKNKQWISAISPQINVDSAVFKTCDTKCIAWVLHRLWPCINAHSKARTLYTSSLDFLTLNSFTCQPQPRRLQFLPNVVFHDCGKWVSHGKRRADRCQSETAAAAAGVIRQPVIALGSQSFSPKLEIMKFQYVCDCMVSVNSPVQRSAETNGKMYWQNSSGYPEWKGRMVHDLVQ